MQDQSDDVRAVAAEALLPLATALAADPPQALQQILWDILLEVEELSPSTGLQECLFCAVQWACQVKEKKSQCRQAVISLRAKMQPEVPVGCLEGSCCEKKPL